MTGATSHVDPSGFRIDFPTSWRIRTDVDGLAVVAIDPGDGTSNVGVIVEATGRPGLTVEEYLARGQRLAPREIDGFEVVASAVLHRDGRTRGVLEYTGVARGTALHHLAVVALHRGRAFTATLTATEDDFARIRPDAEAILWSLRTG